LAGVVLESMGETRRLLVWLAVGIAGVTVLGAGLVFAREFVTEGILALAGLGNVGAPLYSVVYAVGVLGFFPAWVLAVGAGALYGPLLGTLVVLGGAAIGSTVGFALGQTVLRDRVQGWTERHPRILRIQAAVVRRGVLMVFLLRLSPIFPFTLINLSFGLTRMRYGPFIGATVVGMIPPTLAFTSLGSTLSDVGSFLAGTSRPDAPPLWLSLIGALATLAVMGVLARIALKVIQDEEAVDAPL
jgi:uncharacterized membrane protein YdjX (TVP38/TMEM64 family)